MSQLDDLKNFVESRMKQGVKENALDFTITHKCTGCNKTKDILDFKQKKKNKVYQYCSDCRTNLPKLKLLWKQQFPPTTNCECCGVAFNESTPPCADHDHDTMTFRGWLCRNCNAGVGMLNTIELLQKAIKYLQERSNT